MNAASLGLNKRFMTHVKSQVQQFDLKHKYAYKYPYNIFSFIETIPLTHFILRYILQLCNFNNSLRKQMSEDINLNY